MYFCGTQKAGREAGGQSLVAALGLLLVLGGCQAADPSLDGAGGGGTRIDRPANPAAESDAAVGDDGHVGQMHGDGGNDADGEASEAGADRDAGAVADVIDAGDALIEPLTLDQRLRSLITRASLTGDPATPRGLHQIKPADDPLVRLGQVLFFSQTMAGGFDASCGGCHDPNLGGADGLSISVGVVPTQRSAVGLDRKVDATRDLDPLADGGPNMHRGALTTFNLALFDRALFWDGRVFVADSSSAAVPGGRDQGIRTPESMNGVDVDGGRTMLEDMVKLPFVNDNEMRGFMYSDMSSLADYREHLMQRLRGEVDQQYLSSDAPERWLALFRAAFKNPSADAKSVINVLNVSRAVAAFVSSQIFVDTPFRRYIEGDRSAISEDAKRGAQLFLSVPAEGGLGCASCHEGDRFTNEQFANVGFPQLGRGFRRSDRRDVGAYGATRHAENWMAFRVPQLLNVALSAPYGHAGQFATLEDLLRYHANPRAQVDDYDFKLKSLPQFADSKVVYPLASQYTHEAIDNPSFDEAEKNLPARALTDDEVRDLKAFLVALSDDCASDAKCRGAWIPDASLDPDGNMLVRDNGSPAPSVDAPRNTDYPSYVDLSPLDSVKRVGFLDALPCGNGMQTAQNTGNTHFANKTGDKAFGLTAPHGFSAETWDDRARALNPDAVMIAGGASAAYLDDDCWPDIAFAGGDASGLVFYRNRGNNSGFDSVDMLASGLKEQLGTKFTGFAIADMDGDYRRELVIGNLNGGTLPILAAGDDAKYHQIGGLPMSRNTYGIAFGMFGASTYPTMYLAHWSQEGTPGTAPALFINTDGTRLRPYDAAAHTSSAYVDQTWNFTPGFADITGDGRQDLVIASDFQTSRVLENGGLEFIDRTDRSLINDENGMGAALGDFDNDGNIDWFVTSIRDHEGQTLWGITGNRLYRNLGVPNYFGMEDVTEQAGVRDGAWGWGACAADFDHDGFLDIFHVNGFGYIPDDALTGSLAPLKDLYASATAAFQHDPPRLFMNKGDGTFIDKAQEWGIDVPSEGRGVSCFDYDRDGDIDIVLVDQSTGLQFFENEIGHGAGHGFLNVRVIGKAPNTEALGAKVTVVADVGNGHGTQTQLRFANANSNFESQNLPNLEFGLGTATKAKITVQWPDDATVLTCDNVAPNQFLLFDQRAKVCPSQLAQVGAITPGAQAQRAGSDEKDAER